MGLPNTEVTVSKLTTCKHCGDEMVAWVKSEKTGKWYLAEAYKAGDHFIAKRFKFHKCLPAVKVLCKTKQEWIDERSVKFLDIAEDMQGKDQLTFECPLCGKTHTSFRVT